MVFYLFQAYLSSSGCGLKLNPFTGVKFNYARGLFFFGSFRVTKIIPLISNLSNSPSLLIEQFTFSSISITTFSNNGLETIVSYALVSSAYASCGFEYNFSFCKSFISSFCFFGLPNYIAFPGTFLA